MKKIIIIAISILICSCTSSKATLATSANDSQSKETPTNPDILVGKHDRTALQKEPYNRWFNTNYDEYSFDTATVEKLPKHLEGVSIKAFMGTWCGDSKRETPAFYKILDAVNFNYKNLELITVTRAKDTPEGYEKDLQINRVPTFIFYKDGKEIGRYVEFARETLEKDILAIVSGQDYKHSYEE